MKCSSSRPPVYSNRRRAFNSTNLQQQQQQQQHQQHKNNNALMKNTTYIKDIEGDSYDVLLKRRYGEEGDMWCSPAVVRVGHTAVSRHRLTILGIVFFMLVSFMIRFFNLSQPNYVVFDEVHFGAFAGHYIKGTYFFDVHPPLGKLLIAFAGWCRGFDGQFSFENIGMDYTSSDNPKVPWVALRFLPTLCGALLPVVGFVTMVVLRHSMLSAFIVANFLLFENALATQSRLILLDSMLILFIGSAFLSSLMFLKNRSRPYSYSWWGWMFTTGILLSAAVSVKFVGLFLIALVGFQTIIELIWLFEKIVARPDAQHSDMEGWSLQFLSRALGLIVVPVTLYILIFWIHFNLLTTHGPGDRFMDIDYQSYLNRDAVVGPLNVSFGSEISLRVHTGSNRGMLHSHKYSYPESTDFQQVTVFMGNDDNNWWNIDLPDMRSITDNGMAKVNSLSDDDDSSNGLPRQVKHGDVVLLRHKESGNFLHVEGSRRAPMSQQHLEVSAVNVTVSDMIHLWRVELREDTYWKSFSSELQLRHVGTSCILTATLVQLPRWGFGQQEVGCERISEPSAIHDKKTKRGNSLKNWWHVEGHRHELLPLQSSMTSHFFPKPSFLKTFFKIQESMFSANSRITSSHPYSSRPSAWPFMVRGISFWQDHENERQIYLIGNAFVWWLSTSAVLFCFLMLIYLVHQHGWVDILFNEVHAKICRYHGRRQRFVHSTVVLLMAWVLHYLPFYFMERQLFIHHYLPALYFAILLVGVAFDFCTVFWSPRTVLATAACLVLITAAVFFFFWPLTYGTRLPKDSLWSRKWLPFWDFLFLN